jgi:hypothetical protein
MSDNITRKMLTKIRQCLDEQRHIELPGSCKEIINEGQDNSNTQNALVISANDVQFGGVRTSQESAIRKTVGDVSMKPDALKYYPEINDLVINGEVNGLGISFQFRYKDPSGDGCYIWAEGLQMTDANLRTIEKIRDAFLNWKQSLVEDGDLIDKLDKQARKE